MKRLSLLLAFFVFTIKTTPIKIITSAYNRPEFIEWQYHTFKKFMLDDYTFTVYNDAKDPNIRNKIIDVCSKYNIVCIRVPEIIHDEPYLKRLPGDHKHNPSVRLANIMQYMLDVDGFHHDGIVMIIDSDMFLIEHFSVNEYMKGYDLGGVFQNPHGIVYIWTGIVFLNMETMPNKETINWNCGVINGHLVDTGAYTHYYLQDNPTAKVKYDHGVYIGNTLCPSCIISKNFGCTHNRETLERLNFKKDTIQFIHKGADGIEFFCDNNFLHYRNASWNNKSKDYHIRKTNIIREFIESKVNRTLN